MKNSQFLVRKKIQKSNQRLVSMDYLAIETTGQATELASGILDPYIIISISMVYPQINLTISFFFSVAKNSIYIVEFGRYTVLIKIKLFQLQNKFIIFFGNTYLGPV